MERDLIDDLIEIASALEDCESEDDVFATAVDVVGRILAYDAAVFCTVEDDQFRPQAVDCEELVPHQFLSVDEGIAGRTLRTGDPRVVDDLSATADASPTDEAFRSVLSIPVADSVLFQAISTEVGAFSEADRTIGELFVTYVASALARVGYEAELRQEHDQLAALFENIPDPSLRYRSEDGDLVIETVNSAFVRIFGYEAEATVGRSVEDLLVPSTGRDHESELSSSEERDEREVERLTAAGQRRFLLRTVPTITDGPRNRGYLIYTDIEDLKQREEKLRRQNERLEEFASIVSHDLRNPLEVASGYLELVRETGDEEYFETIEDALDRMDALIEDMLAMARHGKAVVESEPVELGAVFVDAWGSVQTGEASYEVTDSRHVRADPGRLARLFENLVRNAVEHGGPAVTVRVGTISDGFYVEDDGQGIPEDAREDVFEFGFTTANTGMGFGFSIVADIAKAHGWEVSLVESDEGGVRVEFTGVEGVTAERIFS